MVLAVRAVNGTRGRPDVGQRRLTSAGVLEARVRTWRGAFAAHLERGDVAASARGPLRRCRVAEVVLTTGDRRSVVAVDARGQRLQSVRPAAHQTRIKTLRTNATSAPLTAHTRQTQRSNKNTDFDVPAVSINTLMLCQGPIISLAISIGRY